MFEEIKMDTTKYDKIKVDIDKAGKALLENKNCYAATGNVAKNIVIPDYVTAYEGLIATIKYLMGVNDKVTTLMTNVMAYHVDIDQTMSDQLAKAGDVFNPEEGD
ncbi:MAG: hypothetical protein E7307_11925 [Butyrivibrio sp.]|nr:hypothetical protein [Butyrivibrio sp.]